MISVNRRNVLHFSMVAAVAGIMYSPVALGLTVPFTEDFTAGSAQWFTDSAGTTSPTHHLSGGPDGSAFVSHSFNFVNSAPTSTPLFFRAQASFGSSGGAFAGDWLDADVAQLSALVRHDAPVDLALFIRITPTGALGVAAVTAPIVPGEWTLITFPIVNTSFVNEGPPGAAFFNNVLGNVGNIQFGALPGAMVGIDRNVVLDLDQVRIVPEPATLALIACGGMLALRGVRGRRQS